jgi:tetratricopeptide (TPR) repeat protein
MDSRQYRLVLATDRNFDRQNVDDARMTSDLAEAHQQLGEFAEAGRLFKRAASLEKDNSRRQALEEKAKQAQAANEHQLENERRRPVMRADLDQPNVVRRRLP